MTRTIKVDSNVINGVLFKHDGNFLSPKFKMYKIAETNIFIGNYPQTEKDCQLIYDSGVTAIFNLQTEEEIFQRGVPNLSEIYQKMGVLYLHRQHQVMQNEQDFCETLYNDSVKLNDLITVSGHTVFIHC